MCSLDRALPARRLPASQPSRRDPGGCRERKNRDRFHRRPGSQGGPHAENAQCQTGRQQRLGTCPTPRTAPTLKQRRKGNQRRAAGHRLSPRLRWKERGQNQDREKRQACREQPLSRTPLYSIVVLSLFALHATGLLMVVEFEEAVAEVARMARVEGIEIDLGKRGALPE